MQLRNYQQNALTQLRQYISTGRNRLILCSPTGSGKTVIFSTIAKNAIEKGRKVLIVTDRIELLKQSGNALAMLNLKPETIEAGKRTNHSGHLYTAMVETLVRRIAKPEYLRLFKSFDLIIFDEAHKQAFNKVFQHIARNQTVIGATATPYRKAGQIPLSRHYHEIVETVTIADLIEQGYLAKPNSFGVPVDLSQVQMRGGDYDESSLGENYSKNRVFEGVIENYLRLTPNKKSIAFCPTIASSMELCSQMQGAGVNAKHLDSTMDAETRKERLKWLKITPNAVLCNVGILTTGFDEPTIEVVILYRATTSLPLFLQMVGRGSRVTETKKAFTILDFGENIRRHGFWEENRKWSLDLARKKKTGVAPAKNCPKCWALVASSLRQCECGHEFKSKQQEKQERTIVELKQLEPALARAKARVMGLPELAQLAKAGVVKPFWVLHNLKTKAEADEFIKLMGWKPGWWHHNRHRFPNLR